MATNILSDKGYKSLPKLLSAFRRVGNANITNEFNQFDSPAHYYFRIFFDFNHGLLDASEDLGDTAETKFNKAMEDAYMGKLSSEGNIVPVRYHNSALNYLVLNNEWERADMLRQFIDLLSNINTYSPWYFQTIEGVSEALTRSEFTEEAFTIPAPKQLTIKCLPDAYDNRIGTLLDLYKSICYSYELHKEILPDNLRSFTMYLYIFNTNIRGIHSKTKITQNITDNPADDYYKSDATYDQHIIKRSQTTSNAADSTTRVTTQRTQKMYIATSKLIQFNFCEFNLNSNASGYGTIDNKEGFQQEYSIVIDYDNAYEQRYNEQLRRIIGDYILGDQDLPENNQVAQIWNKTDAANAAMLSGRLDLTDRLDRFRIYQQDVVPEPDYVDARQVLNETETPNETPTKSKKIFTDVNKTSLLDPWRNIVDKNVQILKDQANAQINNVKGEIQKTINTAKYAFDSWTDIRTLNKKIADAFQEISYGNLFETNMMGRYDDALNKVATGINSIASKVDDKLGKINADKVIEKTSAKAKNGWGHRTTVTS